MSYTVIPITPISNFSPLPAVGMPSFPGEALSWVNNWTFTWVPELNAMAAAVEHNATSATNAATDAVAALADVQAAAAAAVSGGAAVLWVSGGSYVAATASTPASVVLDPDDVARAYRCKADIAGSSTNPRLDPAHWVRLNGLPPAQQEVAVALGADSTLDLSAGVLFSKTVTGSTTLSIINPEPAGLVSSGTLELTNGGANAVTFWPGSKWSNGVVPNLTAAGTDVIGFYTRDGGVTTVLTLTASKAS